MPDSTSGCQREPVQNRSMGGHLGVDSVWKIRTGIHMRLFSRIFSTNMMLLMTAVLWSTVGRSSSIDDLGKGLDLSILDPSPDTSSEPETPALHLFSGFEQAPSPALPKIEAGVQVLRFEKSITLVAPNTPRIDEAYRQLGDIVKSKKLKVTFPLKVILHADGNVSVGCGLETSIDTALPPGTDISPQEETTLMGTIADVQIAERSHPPVVEAVVRIRTHALKQGKHLDPSEIYFLPLEPGKVWVGLTLRQQAARP